MSVCSAKHNNITIIGAHTTSVCFFTLPLSLSLSFSVFRLHFHKMSKWQYKRCNDSDSGNDDADDEYTIPYHTYAIDIVSTKCNTKAATMKTILRLLTILNLLCT